MKEITVVKYRQGMALEAAGDGPCAVYIGRAMPKLNLAASPLANRFRIERGRSREAAIDRYREEQEARLRAQDPELIGELARLRRLAWRRPLALACWCAPEACHGDVVKEWLEPPRRYTGVGARKTPTEILDLMERIGELMAERGYVLETGDAWGADHAFAVGAEGAGGDMRRYAAKDARPESIAIARQYHPAWHRVPNDSRKLHGRNPFQVLGEDLITPVRFLVCWTPDGALTHAERSIRTGGTGTAISIADAHGVPVYNLARPSHRERWELWTERWWDIAGP